MTTPSATWRPSASVDNLQKRAAILHQLRAFFAKHNVMEVETPAMSQAAVTDRYLHMFTTTLCDAQHHPHLPLYLITSPEYHMKRLLAAGSGSIYQICRCFRNEEWGRYHNPEFTLLEWYRIDFTMMMLIDEVDVLLQTIIGCLPLEKQTYQQSVMQHLAIDPLNTTLEELRAVADSLNVGDIARQLSDTEALLQLLFSYGVEPFLTHDRPVAIYNFPATQAALAQINPNDQRIAERFEIYYKGIELANGFNELTQATTQRLRFEEDNRYRAANGLPEQVIDEALLSAMTHGLPACSGVALGIDRLIMLAINADHIDAVIAFPTPIA